MASIVETFSRLLTDAEALAKAESQEKPVHLPRRIETLAPTDDPKFGDTTGLMLNAMRYFDSVTRLAVSTRPQAEQQPLLIAKLLVQMTGAARTSLSAALTANPNLVNAHGGHSSGALLLVVATALRLEGQLPCILNPFKTPALLSLPAGDYVTALRLHELLLVIDV